jgi:endonuclease/exonuclease/phosphatase family metal-dependent hydrolase
MTSGTTGAGAAVAVVVVATHNLMHGRRLERLVPHHLALAEQQGLDLLCVQEDRARSRDAGAGTARPSERIAAALGSRYDVVGDDGYPGLAFIYDTHRLAVRARALVSLPRLKSLTPLEKLWVKEGTTKQKVALLGEVQPRAQVPGKPVPAFAAACFHLDAAGASTHRLTQVCAIAAALAAAGMHRRFVACGDTNAFAWRRQPATLTQLLEPLAAFGASDTGTADPTHAFARQDEAGFLNRLCVLAGRIGLDLPQRYDVVCSNLPVSARGQITTLASDHDLVWARLALDARQPDPAPLPSG